jgi:hypothetical protein
MKDFLGNELKVGDSVVAVELRYRNLLECTVVAITPQKVRLLPWGKVQLQHDPNYHTFLQLPAQIVLIP